MRIEKLTTKFQEALAEGQSLAVSADNQFIEPEHVLLALLSEKDGAACNLLNRAGVNVPLLEKNIQAIAQKLPQIEGSGDVQVGRQLGAWLNLTEKEANKRGDQFVAVELFLLVLADDKGDLGRAAKVAGLTRKSLESMIDAVRGGQSVNSNDAENQREALKKYIVDLQSERVWVN